MGCEGVALLDEMVTNCGRFEPEKVKEFVCQSEVVAAAQLSSSSSPSSAGDGSSSVIEDQELYDLITQLIQGEVGYVEIPLPDGSTLQLNVEGENVTWARGIKSLPSSDQAVAATVTRMEGSLEDESEESNRSDYVSNGSEKANTDPTSNGVTVLKQESSEVAGAIQRCCSTCTTTQVPPQAARLEANLSHVDEVVSSPDRLHCQKKATNETAALEQIFHARHTCFDSVKVTPSLNWFNPNLFPWTMVASSDGHVEADWQRKIAMASTASSVAMTSQHGFHLPLPVCSLCGAMQRLQIFDCQSYSMTKMAAWPFQSNDVISKDIHHGVVQKPSSRHGSRPTQGGRHRLNPKVIDRLRELHAKSDSGLNDSLR